MEIRKSRSTSKAEPLFISTSYHKTIIMESELTVSENKRVCPNVEKLFGVMSLNMLNILDYLSTSVVTFKLYIYIYNLLRWSRGSVLAFGSQVRGFKPGRSRRNFKGEKILRRGRKAVCPMSQICELELRGSRIVGIFLAHEEFHLPLLGVSCVVGREGT